MDIWLDKSYHDRLRKYYCTSYNSCCSKKYCMSYVFNDFINDIQVYSKWKINKLALFCEPCFSLYMHVRLLFFYLLWTCIHVLGFHFAIYMYVCHVLRKKIVYRAINLEVTHACYAWLLTISALSEILLGHQYGTSWWNHITRFRKQIFKVCA